MEQNPFRSDLPLTIESIDSDLYLYLRELTDNLRQFADKAIAGALSIGELELTTRYLSQEYPLGASTFAQSQLGIVQVEFVSFNYEVAAKNADSLGFRASPGTVATSGSNRQFVGLDLTESGAGYFGWLLVKGAVAKPTQFGKSTKPVYVSDSSLSLTPSDQLAGLLTGTTLQIDPALSLTALVDSTIGDSEPWLDSYLAVKQELNDLRQLVERSQTRLSVAVSRIEESSLPGELGVLAAQLTEMSVAFGQLESELQTTNENGEQNVAEARSYALATLRDSAATTAGRNDSEFWAGVSLERSLDASSFSGVAVTQAGIATTAAVNASQSEANALTSETLSATYRDQSQQAQAASQSVANRLIPERPAVFADYMDNPFFFPVTPDAATPSQSGGSMTDGSEGLVRTLPDGATIATRGWLPVIAGRSYRMTVRGRAVTTSDSYFDMYALDSGGNYLGVVRYNPSFTTLYQTVTYVQTAAAIIAAGGANTAYVRVVFAPAGGAMRLATLGLTDVTSEANSEFHATVSQTGAATATAQAAVAESWAQVVAGEVGDLQATVSQHSVAIATHTGQLKARLTNQVIAGSAKALAILTAENAAGVSTSAAGLIADTISLGTAERVVLEVTANKVRINGNLSASAGIFAGDSADPWAVAYRAKTYQAQDGVTINFGLDVGGLPAVDINPTGLAVLGSGETYALSVDNLSATSLVPRLKIVTPGTPGSVSLTTDTTPGTGPTRQIDKAANPDSTDGNYTLVAEGIVRVHDVYNGELSHWTPGIAEITLQLWGKYSGVWQAVSTYVCYAEGGTGGAFSPGVDFAMSSLIQFGNGVQAFGVTISSVAGGSQPALTDFVSVSWSTPGTASTTRSATPAGQTCTLTIRPQG